MRRLRITFILEYPDLSGGVLNAVRVGSLLAEEGHEVCFSARGARPSWLAWKEGWHDHRGFQVSPPPSDLYISTYWTTVRWAEDCQFEPRVHFCQGYEGDLIHLAESKPLIEEVYRIGGPMWVVSPMLNRRLASFRGEQAQVIPPVPFPGFKPRLHFGPRRIPRILVPGIFEAEVKNVPTALRAVEKLRERGLKVDLHRLSTLPCTPEEEALSRAKTYHHGIVPRRVCQLVRSMDLLLFPSRSMEGFGLPVLEACQSGVPCVISDIPSMAPFIEEGLPVADPESSECFADHAERLLGSPPEWRAARATVLQAAKRFSKNKTREALRKALVSLNFEAS